MIISEFARKWQQIAKCFCFAMKIPCPEFYSCPALPVKFRLG
jgi:hypothetical protein